MTRKNLILFLDCKKIRRTFRKNSLPKFPWKILRDRQNLSFNLNSTWKLQEKDPSSELKYPGGQSWHVWQVTFMKDPVPHPGWIFQMASYENEATLPPAKTSLSSWIQVENVDLRWTCCGGEGSSPLRPTNGGSFTFDVQSRPRFVDYNFQLEFNLKFTVIEAFNIRNVGKDIWRIPISASNGNVITRSDRIFIPSIVRLKFQRNFNETYSVLWSFNLDLGKGVVERIEFPNVGSIDVVVQ